MTITASSTRAVPANGHRPVLAASVAVVGRVFGHRPALLVLPALCVLAACCAPGPATVLIGLAAVGLTGLRVALIIRVDAARPG